MASDVEKSLNMMSVHASKRAHLQKKSMDRIKANQMKGKFTKVTIKKDSRLNLDLED